MRRLTRIGMALALAAPGMAGAKTFRLAYDTTVDAVSGPAVHLDAIITTDDGQFYGSNGYLVTAITGTRGTETLGFDPNNFGDEIFYPGSGAASGGTFVDSFGLDIVGSSGTIYNFYRQPSFFAYQEYDGDTARILSNVSLAPVAAPVVAAAAPEPATWAMMLLGFGAIGGALRYRRRTTTSALAPA